MANGYRYLGLNSWLNWNHFEIFLENLVTGYPRLNMNGSVCATGAAVHISLHIYILN